MINLSTPNEELLSELRSDYNRVVHWYSTKVLTPKKLRQKAYELQRRCIDNGLRFCTSDYSETTTKSGNKWIIYTKAERHGEEVMPEIQAFCYYDTLGSGGAFVPGFSKGNVTSCVIFTSHFFLRMKQRLGLGAIDKDVIRRFIEYMGCFHSESQGKGKHGENEAIVHLDGAMGYGLFLDKECNILKVNTFLKDSELNNFQKKQAMNIKDIASKYIDLPHEILMAKLDNGDKAVWQDYEHNLKLMGADPDYMDKYALMLWSIKTLAEDYGSTVDCKQLAYWFRKHGKSYPSISKLICDFGWDFDHREFGRMARNALRELANITPPMVGYSTKVEVVLCQVTELVMSEMNKRRNQN